MEKKKIKKREPTLKQKLAFAKVLKGSTISQAMKDVGYSETTASTTGKLTNADGWKQLMQKYLPDSLLAKRHHALLMKEDEYGPDSKAVPKALDMAYKLKGSYAAEKTASVNLNLNADVKMDEATIRLKDEYEKKLFDQLTNIEFKNNEAKPS